MLSARSGLSSFGPGVPQRGLPVGREPRRPRIRPEPEWEQLARVGTRIDSALTGSDSGRLDCHWQ
jgi:hypothetical protein